MLATQALLQNIRPIDPEYLVGDKIQPGHPLFGRASMERVCRSRISLTVWPPEKRWKRFSMDSKVFRESRRWLFWI
jgi:hypothetical protein